MVVWDSGTVGNGGSYDVRGRRFNSDGAANGNDFVANSNLSGRQDEAAVAAGPLGDFVVVWQSDTPSGNDPSSSIEMLLEELSFPPL